jgi:hypothetical protein
MNSPNWLLTSPAVGVRGWQAKIVWNQEASSAVVAGHVTCALLIGSLSGELVGLD